jgi:hypothetical protein
MATVDPHATGQARIGASFVRRRVLATTFSSVEAIASTRIPILAALKERPAQVPDLCIAHERTRATWADLSHAIFCATTLRPRLERKLQPAALFSILKTFYFQNSNFKGVNETRFTTLFLVVFVQLAGNSSSQGA